MHVPLWCVTVYVPVNERGESRQTEDSCAIFERGDTCNPNSVLSQVRRYLHVVLCFSPVGDRFRKRARQFPALVNCTVFDWFHGWPQEALVSVALRFVGEIPDIDEEHRVSIAQHMAFAHTEVRRCWLSAIV